MYWFQFQTWVRKDVTEGKHWKHENNFGSDGYKCYHECSFAVGVGEKILIKKKMGDSVLQLTDHCQAQLGHWLGHFQHETWSGACAYMSCQYLNLSILNHLNNKDFS